ncbi:hypothetical protein BH24CHL8_BH24CHL8_11770 [soil metagenome]
MSDERDAFEAIIEEAARQEGEMLATSEAVIVGELDRLRPTLATLRYNSAAAFWNALATVTEGIKAEIDQDRDAFKPLWHDLVAALDHLASLKERIYAIRASKQGDTDGPLH